jgi:hypothetical protein
MGIHPQAYASDTRVNAARKCGSSLMALRSGDIVRSGACSGLYPALPRVFLYKNFQLYRGWVIKT